MEATQAQLLNLLDGKKQFIIPIYQRTYSWQHSQCRQLLDDIIKVGSDNKQLTHFIGSIVYFKPNSSPITSVPELLVIDGQQRLTTISLLLLAIIHFLEKHDGIQIEDETWEEILDTYLVNKHRKDDSKYKILLTRKDKVTYTNLVNGVPHTDTSSKRIRENYNFFVEKINQENVYTVYLGVKKLIIVDVILEREKDNPQLIFESLNSTGLDLSQADLIRNYVLMGLPADTQKDLYEKYWYPMEQSFGDKISYLPWFIRDYLTMKETSIPKIDQVYERYKKFLKLKNGLGSIDKAVADLYQYSQYYVRIALQKEKNKLLFSRFSAISKLRIDTSFPFLLAVYHDYENEIISEDEFIKILDSVKNYVFRRAICGIPTNSLNKTFATLYRNVKIESYLESIQSAFLLMDGYKRFPNDAEFKKEILIKDVYSFRSRNYLLESLENDGRKEPVNAENYTIEHVLPQNENVSDEWKKELGDNWKEIQEKYLHTLGNLTLTGYNSEISDKPFTDKKTIDGGFNSSPLFLNESIRSEIKWDEEAILRRARTLAKKACNIWSRPALADERLSIYRDVKLTKNEANYTIEHYEHLIEDMLELYQHLEKRILNIDSSVYVEFKKLYIAFKSQTNFVDIVPQKKRLRLSLNIKFDKIRDEKGIGKDVTNMGRWGNGDVEVGFNNLNDIDYLMALIEQAFEEQVAGD